MYLVLGICGGLFVNSIMEITKFVKRSRLDTKHSQQNGKSIAIFVITSCFCCGLSQLEAKAWRLENKMLQKQYYTQNVTV